MRSAKIHSIDENDHFVDYAEFSWIDRSEEYMRKDEHWSIKLAVVCVVVWLGCALWPWVARIIP